MSTPAKRMMIENESLPLAEDSAADISGDLFPLKTEAVELVERENEKTFKKVF